MYMFVFVDFYVIAKHSLFSNVYNCEFVKDLIPRLFIDFFWILTAEQSEAKSATEERRLHTAIS